MANNYASASETLTPINAARSSVIADVFGNLGASAQQQLLQRKHLHRKIKDPAKIFKIVQEMNEAVAVFRDQLIEIGQAQDSLKVRQKATKLLLICFDLCKKIFSDVQDVLQRNKTFSAEPSYSIASHTSTTIEPPPPALFLGSTVTESMNTVMITFVACMSLFINELEKCYQLFDAFPATERGIVWNTRPLSMYSQHTTSPKNDKNANGGSFVVNGNTNSHHKKQPVVNGHAIHVQQAPPSMAEHAQHNSLLNDVDRWNKIVDRSHKRTHRTIKATESMLAEIERHVQYVVIAPDAAKHAKFSSRVRFSLVPSQFHRRKGSAASDDHRRHQHDAGSEASEADGGTSATSACAHLLQCRPKRGELRVQTSID